MEPIPHDGIEPSIKTVCGAKIIKEALIWAIVMAGIEPANTPNRHDYIQH